MAPIGDIYTYENHASGNKARATAAYAGLELKMITTHHPADNNTPEYKALFPRAKVPGFKSSTGFILVESTAIARYVASLAPNSGLLGRTPEEVSLVDQWCAYADAEIDPFRKELYAIYRGNVPFTKPYETRFREKLAERLADLNTHLHTNTFLVGHRPTVADFVVVSIVRNIFENLDGPAERAKVPNLVRYVETVSNQPGVKDVLGGYKWAEKAAAFTPVKKEKEKKESKPAQIVAAVKEKIAPKKAAAAEEDDDEPSVPEEPKAKNPLDSLPKSSLNLEDWKRAYSNLDTRGPGGSLEWFYEKNDPEGYSIWKVAFKYPEELTQTFMSANQIGGFFNRLEGSRKYLFGSVGVLGESNNSLIEGVLIARGQEIIPVVEVAPDYESYAYEKLDLSNAEQKTYFEGALAWDLEVNGKKWVDGKNFK